MYISICKNILYGDSSLDKSISIWALRKTELLLKQYERNHL
jgi:hypothetical protein